MSSDIGVVAEQLEELRANNNVHSLQRTKPKCYYILYTPQVSQSLKKLSHSPYANRAFNIQFKLPQKYPQAPPSLYFIDKIHHLNVDPANGQVYMPLLHEDWSPFVTLSAILQSLDCILEEPDSNYPVSQSMLNQYRDQPQIYYSRIQQNLKGLSNRQVGNSVGELHSSLVQDLGVIQIEGQGQTTNGFLIKNIAQQETVHKKEDSPKKIGEQVEGAVFQLAESGFIQKEQIQEIVLGESFTEQLQKEPLPQQTKKQVFIEQSKKEGTGRAEQQEKFSLSFGSKKLQNGAQGARILKKVSRNETISEGNLRSSVINLMKFRKVQKYEQVQANLKKADELLGLFMRECQSMEVMVKNTQNVRIRQLLESKLAEQLQMVEQIVNMSWQLKQKLFLQFKNITNQLLK